MTFRQRFSSISGISGVCVVALVSVVHGSPSGRLNTAVAEYRNGFPARAEFSLSVALREPGVSNEPDAIRLKAFLDLRAGRNSDALRNLKRIQTSNEYAALLSGSLELDQRDYSSAENSFKLASQASDSTGQTRAEQLPFFCDENSTSLNPTYASFQDVSSMPELWDKKLSQVEKTFAAYQALVIANHSGKNVEEARKTLKTLSSQIGAKSKSEDSGLIALLKNPDERNHAACFLKLSQLETKLKKNITSGSPAAAKLARLQTRMDVLARNTVFLFPDPEHYLSFADYLSERNRSTESIHVLRAGLRILVVQAELGEGQIDPHSSAKLQNNLKQIAWYLRQLGRLYAATNRASDQAQTMNLAQTMENWLSSPKMEMSELRQKLFLVAGENLRNYESLLVLRRIDPQKETFYRTKMRERNEIFSNQELYEAYQPLYGGPW